MYNKIIIIIIIIIICNYPISKRKTQGFGPDASLLYPFEAPGVLR